MARMRSVLVVILFGAIVIFAGGVTPAHAINCGDTLGPGGQFQLQQDLDCSASFQTALTVKDGAILDLNGHIVTCGPVTVECIALTGAGAQLLDGALRGGFHVGLAVRGIGGHTVKNVTSSTALDDNVIVTSDNNRLINVMAAGVFAQAFAIHGNNNQLSDSIAQCFNLTFTSCINVIGDENRLVDNFVTSTGSLAGLSIAGNNNVVRRNRAIRNGGGGFEGGIVVSGTGNDLRHNTALENSPFDLQDTNGDCVHNTWKFNTFQTADPACIQ